MDILCLCAPLYYMYKILINEVRSECMQDKYFKIWLFEIILLFGLEIFFYITGFSVMRCLILNLISISMLFSLKKYLKNEWQKN